MTVTVEPDSPFAAPSAPATPAPAPADVQPEPEPQPSGAIVAWWLPIEAAAALWSCIPADVEAEEPDELHVTLAYLGDADALDEVARLAILTAIETVAAAYAPLAGTVGGLGVFPGNDETRPFFANVDVPGLTALREGIVAALRGAGVEVDAAHGFSPHITLAYQPADAPLPADVERLCGQIPVGVDRLTVAIGGQRHSYPLTGAYVSKDAGAGPMTTGDLAAGGGLKRTTQRKPARPPKLAKREPSAATQLVAKGLPAPMDPDEFPSTALDANFPPSAELALQWIYTQVARARANPQDVDAVQWFEQMQEEIGRFMVSINVANEAVAKAADAGDAEASPESVTSPAGPRWAEREAVRLFHEHAMNADAYEPRLVARTRRGRLMRVEGPGAFGYVLLPVTRTGPGRAAVLATVSPDTGTYWVDEQLVGAVSVERACELDGAPTAWDAELRAALTALPKPGAYRIFRSAEERRYTLGVAYPANQLDSHGDFTTPDELEAAAWHYLKSGGGAGMMHWDGTDGAGEVVESYIYRGPDWEIADQVVKPGDWLLGVVWGEPAWTEIKAGRLTGYSFQGLATRVERSAALVPAGAADPLPPVPDHVQVGPEDAAAALAEWDKTMPEFAGLLDAEPVR